MILFKYIKSVLDNMRNSLNSVWVYECPTHDAFTASYARRVIFIKDGKIFKELHRGDDSRKNFFNQIIDVVTLLGGDMNDAL